ncbi:MAG TPA: DUF3810 domain-containing protein [Flavobacteriaceae bacterium]|nr:DUF3810 domain-containing protein [Flavobacteriaceae bacterium]
MKQRVVFVLAVLLPIQIGGINLLSRFPNFVEKYYSFGLYPIISKIERFLLGWIPFSVGDVLYAFLIFMLLRWLYLRLKNRFRFPKKWILEALAVLSVLYFSFHFLWGFNYYRLPLHQSLGIETEYTTAELADYTDKLIKKANLLHFQITENDSVKVEFPYEKDEILKMTIAGYQQIQWEFPALDYAQKSLKPSLFSIPLSYMGFNGYLNPFTNEAQVNTQLPKFKIPSTASHEVGHQMGFAKENEANFIACLVSMQHPDIYFRYAGTTFALRYCLNTLYFKNRKMAEKLGEKIHYGIKLNYREMEQFWEAYENPMEIFFKVFYGSYLKVNNQPEGMRSYTYVVGLLVNYAKMKNPSTD